ncbi:MULTISPECIES: hypothetical protein [unclassified Breznakia]|uniref:hypothetical protein n=1 Tax=unclassified Breznakia TaxID=2623764 RepID=UPI0024748A7D|nr:MULTISPECIES: hypothetical protein [unclassified Breznakia]MDH6367571.1 hypothetical protein [Breznakia sp. PH1-1]MDH6404635.1 hypothetical protein [Breznakia sp. PF1-11]MDH6412401.1 hypothetical protein [Breznakia sp. PFB1-11]MDH6414739.1 hypothetical protein [Breznakia sp. PFB1-14]MDH6417016.1 hypothetical protein [Breznakia sp. PFB1-4]
MGTEPTPPNWVEEYGLYVAIVLGIGGLISWIVNIVKVNKKEKEENKKYILDEHSKIRSKIVDLCSKDVDGLDNHILLLQLETLFEEELDILNNFCELYFKRKVNRKWFVNEYKIYIRDTYANPHYKKLINSSTHYQLDKFYGEN